MAINHGVTTRRPPLLLTLPLCALLSGSLIAAEAIRVEGPLNQQEVQQEVEREQAVEQADQQALSETPVAADTATTETTSLDNRPRATHATQEAPDELLSLAAANPENFVGRTLVLMDATKVTTVGRVLRLRKRVEDQNLYLIVDATQYFNSPTEFAVAVKDVARLEADRVVIPEAPGMHLKGMEYHAEDYNDEFGPQ